MKMMNNIEKLISWLKADADILEGYLIKRLYLREEKCFWNGTNKRYYSSSWWAWKVTNYPQCG